MDNSTVYSFEISFAQDYRSEDQLYREGQWYNISRITNHTGFRDSDRAVEEARSLAHTFHKMSGVELQWRVKREEVIESGTL